MFIHIDRDTHIYIHKLYTHKNMHVHMCTLILIVISHNDRDYFQVERELRNGLCYTKLLHSREN